MTHDDMLSRAPVTRLVDVLRAMDATPGPDDVARLGRRLGVDFGTLHPLLAAAEELGFTVVENGDYELTEAGRAFVRAGESERRRIFAEHAVRTRGVAAVRAALGRRRRVPRERVVEALAAGLTAADAERLLATAADWGRYGGLFDYDAAAGAFVRLPERKGKA